VSTLDSGWSEAPDVVLLLRDDAGHAGGGQHGVVLLASDEALLLPVWSSLDRLVELAGDDRPWLALHAREVEDLRRQLDAVVALDPAWPSDLPTAAPE
jgi:hypothetical protein